jgi:hypothetical protein
MRWQDSQLHRWALSCQNFNGYQHVPWLLYPAASSMFRTRACSHADRAQVHLETVILGLCWAQLCMRKLHPSCLFLTVQPAQCFIRATR